MKNAETPVMSFSGSYDFLERTWSKRDAFILTDCDKAEYANTPQRSGTYILIRKTQDSLALIDEFLEYAQDPRIITDMPNQLGKENYSGFKENRHDQTLWSLLTKKKNIKPFRDPSQWAYFCPRDNYPKDMLERSSYPQIVYSHRRSVQFNRTVEDILRIYGNEPRLCEGVRTAKYLIQDGMVKESYEVLWRLLQKYRTGNDAAWSNILEDLLYIFFRHQELGSPYAETFLPLLYNLTSQIMYRKVDLHEISFMVQLPKYMKNKNLIPEEFRTLLVSLMKFYISQAIKPTFPLYLPSAEEILETYSDLNMPETPLLQEAISELVQGGAS